MEGHREAFDEIVERHRRNIYQLCYRFVNNHEDASDLAQDVFVRAFKGLGNFKNESSLGTWLYRVGVNACLNRVATKKVETEPIDAAPRVDPRGRSAPRGDAQRARGGSARGDCQAAAEAACDADASRVSGALARGDRQGAWQFGRRRQGEFFPRAGKSPAPVAVVMTHHLSPQEFVEALDGTLADARLDHLDQCERCRRNLDGFRSS